MFITTQDQHQDSRITSKTFTLCNKKQEEWFHILSLSRLHLSHLLSVISDTLAMCEHLNPNCNVFISVTVSALSYCCYCHLYPCVFWSCLYSLKLMIQACNDSRVISHTHSTAVYLHEKELCFWRTYRFTYDRNVKIRDLSYVSKVHSSRVQWSSSDYILMSVTLLMFVSFH